MLIKLVPLFFLRLLEGVVSVLITLVCVVPSFLFLLLVNECVRRIVSVLIYFKYGSGVELTDNGLDNVWGYKTPHGGNSRNVLFIAVYENKIDGYRYRAKFLDEVINFIGPDGTKPYLKLKKIFTQAYGFFCWREDENFDIANHIIVRPDDKVVTETEMLKMLGDLSVDMSDNVPQWQEIIIPRFQYDKDINGNNDQERSLRILRFHHSYGDAGSWILLYSYCMAGGKIPYAVNPLKGYPVPAWQKFLYYLNSGIFGTTTALKAVWNARYVDNRLVTNRYNGEKFYAWTDHVDLSQLKDIKRKTSTSIPTILASIVAGALKNFDEKFPLKDRRIGEVTEVGAVAAILPYPNLNPQNRFTIANFLVPTGNMTRIARLRWTHKKGIDLAQSPEPIVNFYLFKFFGRFPIRLQRILMRTAGTSMIFSNLPGASETFYLFGDAVRDGAAWVPLLTVAGLSISAAGYKNGLRFCGVTDSACMSRNELEYLLDELKNEIQLLSSETVGLV